MGSLISNTETRSEIPLNNRNGKAQTRVSKQGPTKERMFRFIMK
jgi:hypothetical protein